MYSVSRTSDDDSPREYDEFGRAREHYERPVFDKHSHVVEDLPEGFQEATSLQPNIVIRGRITRMEPYGVFCEFGLGNNRYCGLVHISQLSHERVASVEDVVQMHQVVFCKVLDVDDNGHRQRIRLSMKGVDQKTGKWSATAPPPAAAHAVSERAIRRERMFRDAARDTTWKKKGPPTDYERLLWSRSPSPPPKAKAIEPDESDSESSASSSSSESSSSSSSEDSHRRRRRKRRGSSRRHSKDRRSSRSIRRRRHRRRRSPSTSSESSSSSCSSSESSSSSSQSSSDRSRDKKRVRKESVDDGKIAAVAVPTGAVDAPSESAIPAMDDDDLREAREFRGAVQGHHDEDNSDDDDEGPMPLPQSTTAATAKKNAYGGALLPGEGQAIAQYVQQNLRIPRRGEIGYSGNEIESYEKSGYVMSGSRHARMNAVRIRKENQVYSAEEQRALALITMEENQQKEAQLLQDFRTMLKEKQKQRERKDDDAGDVK